MNEDFVAWHLTKSYTFSVRSAYYAQWNATFRQRWTGFGRTESGLRDSLEITSSIQGENIYLGGASRHDSGIGDSGQQTY